MSDMRILIAPSLLAADFAKLKEEVQAVEAAGADWLHVDVMDGHFVPNITMGPFIVEAIKRVATVPLDVHLMIQRPERYIEAFAKAGADWLSIQLEAEGDTHRALELIAKQNVKPALVINPPTAVEKVKEYRDQIQMLLIMTIFPGFGGQKLMPECLPKFAEARRMFGADLLLEIDGGVTLENAAQVRAAGAEVIVAGTAIFRSADVPHAIRTIRG
jgi:ribulose-phosphate 3-epimerase